MVDKIRIEGNTRVEPIADSKVRRILEVIVEANIFGVGGLMESSLEKNIWEEADHTALYFANKLK